MNKLSYNMIIIRSSLFFLLKEHFLENVSSIKQSWLSQNGNTSQMSKDYPEFTKQVHSALKSVEKKLNLKPNECNLSGDIQDLSKDNNETIDQSLQTKIEKLFSDFTTSRKDKPVTIFLAACFTDFSDLREHFKESGICSVLCIKNERGAITNGKCFKLDKDQARLLEIVKEDHARAKTITDLQVKHILLSGSFGTGKTITLIEIFWMRVYFFLRKLRDNVSDEGGE